MAASERGALDARTAAASERGALDARTPPLYFAVLASVTLLAGAYELAIRQPRAYLVPGFGLPRWSSALALVTGALLTALLVRRARREARASAERITGTLIVLALWVSASAGAWFWGARSFVLTSIAALAIPAGAGACSALFAADTWPLLAPHVARHGVFTRLLNPLRALLLAFAITSASVLASWLGLLRTALALGLFTTALGSWWHVLRVYLHLGESSARVRWLNAGVLLLQLSALLGCEWLLPMSELSRYANPVVYARTYGVDRYVITSGHDTLELFVNQKLRVSSLDHYRYSEALVHPALAFAPSRKRVLLIGGGHGSAERELLRYPEAHVTSLTEFSGAAHLTQHCHWLKQLSESALGSPRVTIVTEEPAVYLQQPSGQFDVILIDLPDPDDYAAGKYYTRYFYAQLIAKHLAPGGVIAVQATSQFSSPRTYESIRATLLAADLRLAALRAPIPAFGEWSFLLGSREPLKQHHPLPDELAYLHQARLEHMLTSPDRTPAREPVTLLHEPHVVDVFARERDRLH